MSCRKFIMSALICSFQNHIHRNILCTSRKLISSGTSRSWSRSRSRSVSQCKLSSTASSFCGNSQIRLQQRMVYYEQERSYSTAPKIISDRLKLHQPVSRQAWSWEPDPKKVLVLYFPWLNAQDKHAAKYRDLYLSRGLDVLTVSSDLKDFLWPPNSKQLGQEVVKVLHNECQDYDHILIHSMSIGSYNMTVMRMVAQEEEFKNLPAVQKCCGMVYDSMVAGGGKGGLVKTEHLNDGHKQQQTDEKPVHAIDRMLHGVVESFTQNLFLRLLIKGTGKVYFAATKKHTTEFYDEALAVVRENPVLVRTLLLASKDDPMCDPTTMEQLLAIWREDGVPVELQLWNKSKHAQHLVYHREDYLQALDLFLEHVFGAGKPVAKAKL